jgi:hypothetical protein
MTWLEFTNDDGGVLAFGVSAQRIGAAQTLYVRVRAEGHEALGITSEGPAVVQWLTNVFSQGGCK